MLRLSVTFADERTVSGVESADLFWNVDASGLASGAIDDDSPLNGSPILLWPGYTGGPEWGTGAWGTGFWSGESRPPAAQYLTPPVCFGLVRIGGKARDGLGNYQDGAILEAEYMVNSTPLPANRLKRGAYTGGRQAFTFTPSPQIA